MFYFFLDLMFYIAEKNTRYLSAMKNMLKNNVFYQVHLCIR